VERLKSYGVATVSFRTINLIVLLLVAAIILPYNYWKRTANFVQVDAIIQSVENKCQRDGTTLGAFQKAEPQAMRDCTKADLSPGQMPFKALIAQTIFVRYVSPVDQKEHSGSVRRIGFLKDLEQTPAVGSLSILASRSQSEVIESIAQ
jgi:hypothetical protein